MLLNSIIECRKEFTNHLNKTRPTNTIFGEDFLENPGFCLNTYYPKNAENVSFHYLKEDFTFLLKKKLELKEDI